MSEKISLEHSGRENKARKALSYERFLKQNGYNAVVTCGGIHSNHNRAIALMAMANGWKCHLVYHGSKSDFEKGGGNSGIVKMSGASYEFVEVNDISDAMDKAMQDFKNKVIIFMEVDMICLVEKLLLTQ